VRTSTESGTGGHTAEKTVVALACLGQFMVMLDISIVTVALPSIQGALGFSSTGLQWVVNAYTLTLAGFLLLGGRAGDLFGRKQVFIGAIGLFTLASLLGGVAPTAGLLVAARAVQGIGAAFMSPATLALITTTIPEGPRRSSAIGMWTAVAGAAGACGSILGGVLTDYLSWRWVLLVNIPIGIVLIAGSLRSLHTTRNDGPRKLDVFGAITVTLGLSALVYGIVQTDTYGWLSARVLVPLVAGLVLLGVFGWIEQRLSAAPLIRLALFASRAVSGGNLIALVMNAAFLSMWYFVSLYLQNVLDFSPLQAGLAFIPDAAMVMISAKLGGRLLAKVGVRQLILLGAVSALIGFVWQAQVGPHSNYVLFVLLPGVLMSAGVGFVFAPVSVAATSGVARSDAGLVSGLLNTSRQIGGALGLGILVAIAADRSRSAAGSAAVSKQALVSGYSLAFLVAAGFVLVGALTVAVLPRRRSAPAPVARPVSAAGPAKS
jgi:EmrB/QacA subfamily drug resistance transporter